MRRLKLVIKLANRDPRPNISLLDQTFDDVCCFFQMSSMQNCVPDKVSLKIRLLKARPLTSIKGCFTHEKSPSSVATIIIMSEL